MGASRLVDATSKLFRKSKNGDIQQKLLGLEALVSSLTPFEATDPRDTIYAVLALASDVRSTADPNEQLEEVVVPESPTAPEAIKAVDVAARKFLSKTRRKPNFRVDYTKPAYEVCKDFLDFAMKRSMSLDIICRPWAPDTIESLPSWIRNLSGAAFGARPAKGTGWKMARKNADSLVGPVSGGKTNYLASGPTEARYRWGRLACDDLSLVCTGQASEVRSLIVTGFVLSRVAEAATVALAGTIPNEWWTMPAVGWTDPEQRPPDRFWRTLVADRDFTGATAPTYYALALQFALNHTVRGGDMQTEELMHHGGSKVAGDFLRRVQAVTWNRVLIVSDEYKDRGAAIQHEKEWVGLAPKGTRRDDLICIWFGWWVTSPSLPSFSY